MKNLGWIIAGVSAGVLCYLYLNPPQQPSFSTGYDDVDDAADRVNQWGAKQRLGGTGSDLAGKVKEGFGRLTGDEQTTGEGVLDQTVGQVKNIAGQGAQAVSDTIHDLNK